MEREKPIILPKPRIRKFRRRAPWILPKDIPVIQVKGSYIIPEKKVA